MEVINIIVESKNPLGLIEAQRARDCEEDGVLALLLERRLLRGRKAQKGN